MDERIQGRCVPRLIKVLALLAIIVVVAFALWYLKAPIVLLQCALLLGAAFLCVLILQAALALSQLVHTLAVMWLPIAVILGASFFLFFNDQGRELGVGSWAKNGGGSSPFS